MSDHNITPTPAKAVSTPNKWPSAKHLQESVVKLIVGSEKKAYTLHKELLCFYSDYFRAAFNGSFKEATERKLEIADVEQEIFELFQFWIYTRRLDCTSLTFIDLAKLWIFGDQHQIPLLQNCVMDEIMTKRNHKRQFDPATIKLAYEKTLTGSPLRRACIDIIAYTILLGPDDARNVLNIHGQDIWSFESLADLVSAVDCRPKNLRHTMPPRDKCYFHVHGKDEHC